MQLQLRKLPMSIYQPVMMKQKNMIFCISSMAAVIMLQNGFLKKMRQMELWGKVMP